MLFRSTFVWALSGKQEGHAGEAKQRKTGEGAGRGDRMLVCYVMGLGKDRVVPSVEEEEEEEGPVDLLVFRAVEGM
jgi:hypothetical protein